MRLPEGNRVVQQEVWGFADFKRFFGIFMSLSSLYVFFAMFVFFGVLPTLERSEVAVTEPFVVLKGDSAKT